MRTEKLVAIVTWVLAMAIGVGPQFANACAVCGLGPNDVGGHAFNTSVLFMMGVPYTTVLIIGGAVYIAWRRSRHKDLPIDGTRKH